MAEPFQYHFSERLLESESQLNGIDPRPDTFFDDVVDQSVAVVSAIEQLRELPERNQALILAMAREMICEANERVEAFEASAMEHFWGLYLIGSRASGEAHPKSDLDLLSVGSFGLALNFLRPYETAENRTMYTPFDDFARAELTDDELPDEYNVGEIDRKYWVMAFKSKEGRDELLDVDLAVVDLTNVRGDLDDFEAKMDVKDGEPLPRIPLVKLTVEQHQLGWTP